MAETDEAPETKGEKIRGSRFPLILGLVLAVLGGVGGFLAVRAGLLPVGASGVAGPVAESTPVVVDFGNLVFVPVEPLVVSYAETGRSRHLRFRAELEVNAGQSAEVARIMPRVVDVLNTYLRALRLTDLEESSALLRLRGQMLRRVQAVVGEGRVNDLLVMEFVLD
ncbi:flagellar basal body-associated FliL family protein [Roseovarius autotrophicus]|uniref:flagellar basal body-associated FliL family protein n=1 Tax=Roseovarius autotrophicus TaxID=2824121 RepID=UPI001B3976AD|nr:flagellar basal body-associated FliL family protein [Roseovarius autotrophicus]